MFDKIIQSDLNCISILTKINISEYLDFVEKIYQENGGIAGQRAPLKTKTAITIRNRMVADIAKGAVLPPVVIGLHINHDEWSAFFDLNDQTQLMNAVGEPHLGRVSIIDGMQRTTAIIDAAKTNPSVLSESIRVEFWISDSLNNLIYRMLVLNTGQVPWDMSRQLKTIYSPLLSLIEDKLSGVATVFNSDKESRRRTRAGQYQSENLIQLLLNFSSGKYEMDLKDKVAEDFARLDLIESSSHEMFLDYFIDTITIMTKLDDVFSTYIASEDKDNSSKRYFNGNSIFKSFPAQVGFCVAVSNYIFDEPGFTVDWDTAVELFEETKVKLEKFIDKLRGMDNDGLGEFLELDILDELMNVKKSQVGRVERRFFTEAFLVMLKNSERLDNMSPCWRKA